MRLEYQIVLFGDPLGSVRVWPEYVWNTKSYYLETRSGPFGLDPNAFGVPNCTIWKPVRVRSGSVRVRSGWARMRLEYQIVLLGEPFGFSPRLAFLKF